MIEDLRIRNYSPRTVDVYVSLVARYAEHYGCSPATLGPEDIRAYQVYLLERGTSWAQVNQTVCALRFFYRVRLKRPWAIEHLPYGKKMDGRRADVEALGQAGNPLVPHQSHGLRCAPAGGAA